MESIRSDIDRFIRTGAGAFEPLALALFAYQFERTRPYRAFCEALGRTPSTVNAWQDIPAVPIRAFKSSALTTVSPARAAAVFHSSATTATAPSRHYLADLRYYETALKSGFFKWVLQGREDRRVPFLILTPSPADAPNSSLAWMMDVVKRAWGAPESGYFIVRGRLDEPRLSLSLQTAQASGTPVFLLGTTLAFLSLFDFCKQRSQNFHLPEGSRLMDTGGMKTLKRETTRSEFLEQTARFLGIQSNACVNEYGMCELSSQFYAIGADPVLRGPVWIRAQAIDSETGLRVSPGEKGLLRYLDLANVESVAAIQSDDLGILREDGFELLGRAPGADLKGCSLSAEALLQLR